MMQEAKTLKTCARCRKRLPIVEFGNDSKHRDGKRKHCKACEREARSWEGPREWSGPRQGRA